MTNDMLSLVLLGTFVVSCASQAYVNRFCNETITTSFKTSCRSCSTNKNLTCPDGSTKLTIGQGDADCTITVQLTKKFVLKLTGCRHTCERVMVTAACCKGYWGPHCRACPGGANNTCSHHGYCSDGVSGNGTCYSCDNDFTGFACENCENSSRYGPNCTAACKCVHGICNAGIHGDGTCTCESGYEGRHCDKTIASCKTEVCHENARCTVTNEGPVCVCNYGYELNGSNCQHVDRCAEVPPICHAHATCTVTGPALFQCQCKHGYRGDGFMCVPIDPCQQASYGECPSDTTQCVYEGPGQRSCQCLAGYENYVDGVGCNLIDVCLTSNTFCHYHANCTTVSPGQIDCVCEEGYIGDGRTCYGNIVQRIQELHASDQKLSGKFTYLLRLMTFAYSEPLSAHGPFTFFVATDDAFHSARISNKIFEVKDWGRQLLRQHIIAAQLTLSDLSNATEFYTLEGNSAELMIKNDELKYKLHGMRRKSHIVRGDIIAANGIIHVIDSLMDKPPTIVGNLNETLATLIKNRGRYNKFEVLLETAGLGNVLAEHESMVVFAPQNRAWDAFPPGTLDYLTSHQGKGKLQLLLKNHIVKGTHVLATDLINLYRFISICNTATTVTLTSLGRLRLNGNVNITQTDIPASNGFLHHLDGVLIPSAIQPILPHRCDIYTFRGVLGVCGPCHSELRCPFTTDVPLNETVAGCRYWVNMAEWGLNTRYISFTGCAQMCNRTTTIPRCCDGFYGQDCYPCPGGFQNVCFGRGQCSDGYEANGTCHCESLFNGAACEFCRDNNKFGPKCDKGCSCLHGECDNRVMGNGKCKPGTCKNAFRGASCDRQPRRCGQALRCHVYADCIRKRQRVEDFVSQTSAYKKVIAIFRRMTGGLPDRYICQCKPGYEGSGTKCIEVDPCKTPDRGGCHQQAKCEKTGPGQSKCVCDVGWQGDGMYCYPRLPCRIHNDCHPKAKCLVIAVGQSNCVCRAGYHGNGTYCVLTDICQENNGGCHQNASCVAIAPGEANCTCGAGLGGDGITCYGSVAHQVSSEPKLSFLRALIKKVPAIDDYLADLNRVYTLLAPDDIAMSAFITGASSKFWQQQDNLLLMLGYHTVDGAVTVEDMKTTYAGKRLMVMADDGAFNYVNVTLLDGVVYLNDAKILQADLPAINGYIHIIDKVLEPYPVPAERPTLEIFLNQHVEFSIFATFLKAKGMIEKIEALNSSYTLFAPLNRSVRSVDTTNMSDVLPYYVVPGEYRVEELQQQVILSTLLGASTALYFTKGSTNTPLINGVEIVARNMQTRGGIVHGINGLLEPRLNRCDQVHTVTVWGTCVPCSEVPPCPSGFMPAVPKVMSYSCQSLGSMSGSQLTGCRIQCQKTFLNPRCCDGFVQPDCKDPCQTNNGGCHAKATCQVVGNEVTCSCKLGYVGDGYDCKSPCHLYNGGCHFLAGCTVNKKDGAVHCTCPQGFQGNGWVCFAATNPCEIENGGCSRYATCEYLHPQVLCTCKTHLVGNGTMCNSDILHTLSLMQQTSVFYKLLKLADAKTTSRAADLLQLLGTTNENLTVFVPVNTAFKDHHVQQLNVVALKNHVVAGQVYLYPSEVQNGTRLVTLLNKQLTLMWQRLHGDVHFQVNGVDVVERNIPTTNGVLHLIAEPLFDRHIQVSHVSVKWMGQTGVIMGCVGGSLLLLIITLLTIYKLRHHISELLPNVNRPFDRLQSEVVFAHNCVEIQQSTDDRDPMGEEPVTLHDDEQPSAACFDNPAYNMRDDVLLFAD